MTGVAGKGRRPLRGTWRMRTRNSDVLVAIPETQPIQASGFITCPPARPQESRKGVEYRAEWEKVHVGFMMIRFVGRNQKRVNDRVQLEADSTIRAGGYLEQRERVAPTAHAPIVEQIAGQFALDPKYTKARTARLTTAGRPHNSQAQSIGTKCSHARAKWGGIFPRSTGGGDWCREGRTASAGSMKSTMLPGVDGKW
ncbi:hypothetical protein B0H17DRAFT_1185584 [Mycena rosella]|uniref:Uncharacterized protein n=1 Tax=Mycena rosella TaxID=1033263 RepID=A0AAD7CQQ6_MYCRO|nr:hypothetical protein B0H17DRAFT_1185584 [Mycena rosella]